MEATLRSLAMITMATACTFDSGGLRFVADDSTSDAGAATSDGPTGTSVDANLDLPDAGATDASCPGSQLAIVPSNIDLCDIPAAASSLDFEDRTWVVNTSTATLVDVNANEAVPFEFVVVSQTTGGSDVVLVAVDSITIGANGLVLVVGNRPLVMLAYSNITIDGILVAGGTASLAPPGTFPDGCASGTGADGVVQDGSGSGAGGGGYGSKGGGGARVNGAGGALIIASGGAANGNAEITPLRGGCGGGDGAHNPSGGGGGGGGGGALQLVAGGTITIGPGAAVSAPGEGATGTESQYPLADDEAGGGGGGSGGAILIEATDLNLAGAVTANGGGGSEATSVGNEYVGCDGENGIVNSDMPARGGVCEITCWGGDGGNGAALTSKADDGMQGESNFDGGGGGGGGVGRIHFNTVNAPTFASTALVSPAQE